MQFTKLRLVGFKSFVEPQEFVIDRGLTGVVGPNGCGKSNLVEALRWVMGENAYKNMRASSMDDVIFSGSSARPPRNVAEVTVFLDNSDGTAPPAFHEEKELQVLRRIERDSGSTYRINAKNVRAKDVQLLFADQATGARSPSMVGQGRIGELIQAKPQARRILLEEAAGISGLHSRRYETELRLRAAENNLDRLENIVGDLLERIESLKRQVRQANRFKLLSARIREVEAGVFYLRWAQAKSQEVEAESALTQATSFAAEKAQAHICAEKARDESKQCLPSLREKVAQVSAAHQRFVLTLRQLEEEALQSQQRQSDVARRLGQLDADIEREKQLLQDNDTMLSRLDDEYTLLSEGTGDEKKQQDELALQLKNSETQLEDCQMQYVSLTAKRAEVNAENKQSQKQAQEVADKQKKREKTLAKLEQDTAVLQTQIDDEGDSDVALQQLKMHENSVVHAQETVQEKENDVAKARESQASARVPVSEHRDQLNRLTSEKDTLNNLMHDFSAGDFPPIVDQITVQKGYEVALGAALGDGLAASFDVQAPVFWQDRRPLFYDPRLPDSIACLADFVRAPAALDRRLKQVGIIESEQGFVLQRQLKTGQCLVSCDGALWRWDGLCACADAPSASAQRLTQKNRLVELETLIEEQSCKLQQAEAILQESKQHLDHCIQKERKSRAMLCQTQDAREKTRENYYAMERKNAHNRHQLSVMNDNKTRVLAEIEDGKKNILAIEQRRAVLPDISSLDDQIQSWEKKVFQQRRHVADAQAALQTLEREAMTRRRRITVIDDEKRHWKNRLANAHGQIAALQERRLEVEKDADNLAAAPGRLETQKQLLLDEISTAQTEETTMKGKLADVENQQTLHEKHTAEAFSVLSNAREQRARAEERLGAANDRRHDIEARIAEALNCSPQETIKLSGLKPAQKMPPLENLEQKLEKLRLDREKLGAVNLRAEEEQQELCKRYDAMVYERDDIIEAIKKLRAAIQDLNREGRERLLAAFHKVGIEFQRLFSHLFDGGQAELKLTETDDPLDAGLEIMVRPPGKKMQTMTLLSGGEQALTAMALVFAVFLTNPAPICVLDEVDAPLDDYNVERYCHLLEQMAVLTKTCFIIITHNPITMSRMNRLFGVTMAEKGVSQLVSVDLNMAEQLREIV